MADVPPAAPAPTDASSPEVVTAGPVAVGHGVEVLVTDGWQAVVREHGVAMSDGRLIATLGVVAAEAGLDPKTIIDTYVLSVLDPIGTVTYSAATLRWTTDTPRPTMQYELFYSAVEADGDEVQGGLSTFVRDDGLVLFYEVWAPAGVTGALPDAAFTSLLNSFLGAPSTGGAAPLNVVPDFQVATVHPQGV